MIYNRSRFVHSTSGNQHVVALGAKVVGVKQCFSSDPFRNMSDEDSNCGDPCSPLKRGTDVKSSVVLLTLDDEDETPICVGCLAPGQLTAVFRGMPCHELCYNGARSLLNMATAQGGEAKDEERSNFYNRPAEWRKHVKPLCVPAALRRGAIVAMKQEWKAKSTYVDRARICDKIELTKRLYKNRRKDESSDCDSDKAAAEFDVQHKRSKLTNKKGQPVVLHDDVPRDRVAEGIRTATDENNITPHSAPQQHAPPPLFRLPASTVVCAPVGGDVSASRCIATRVCVYIYIYTYA
jgi:hypothetical protein